MPAPDSEVGAFDEKEADGEVRASGVMAADGEV